MNNSVTRFILLWFAGLGVLFMLEMALIAAVSTLKYLVQTAKWYKLFVGIRNTACDVCKEIEETLEVMAESPGADDAERKLLASYGLYRYKNGKRVSGLTFKLIPLKRCLSCGKKIDMSKLEPKKCKACGVNEQQGKEAGRADVGNGYDPELCADCDEELEEYERIHDVFYGGMIRYEQKVFLALAKPYDVGDILFAEGCKYVITNSKHRNKPHYRYAKCVEYPDNASGYDITLDQLYKVLESNELTEKTEVLPSHILRKYDDGTWIACDGKCRKAWGANKRDKLLNSKDVDDFCYLSDSEIVGDAPEDPGTYEGGYKKEPKSLNKWCARECERSGRGDTKTEAVSRVPDFNKRVCNIPDSELRFEEYKTENKE